MTDAIQTLITDLAQNRRSGNGVPEPVHVPINVEISAWQEVEGAISPLIGNQTSNTVYAGPVSGAPAVPAFRALVGQDIPNPTATTKGGVKSFAPIVSPPQWLTGIGTDGTPSASIIYSYQLQDEISPLNWTPTDASGAGLTFSSVQVNGFTLNNLVWIYGRLTFPVTGSAAPAAIGGIPYPIYAIGYADGNLGFACQNQVAGLFPIWNGAEGTSIMNFQTQALQAITNAQLSGALVKFSTMYLRNAFP